MNIFVLNQDPVLAAKDHCNKHVVKMVLESGTMLCTSHWLRLLESKGKKLTDFKRVRDAQQWLFENTPKEVQPPWKMSHVRHPCTIWTNKNISNYMWHLNLCESLLAEYTLRYKKNHKSENVAKWLRKNIPVNIESAQLTNFAVCMKDEYKIYQEDSRLDPVASYRNYYLKDKVRFAKWEPRTNTPSWFKENKNE